MARDSDLSTILEEERRLILSGAWAELDALAPRKEAALSALEDDPAGLSALAARLGRNQMLLASAIEGLREVARRRSAMGSARDHLATYDARGLRADLPVAPPRLERKA
jgi:hypothetical protein